MRGFLLHTAPVLSALFVGILGMVWSVTSINRERDAMYETISFAREPTTYHLYLRKECFGTIMTDSYQDSEGWTLRMRGSVMGQIINGTYSFNSLKNLIGSTTTVKGTDLDLFIGTLGIVDIQVTVLGSFLHRTFSFRPLLSGPIVLKVDADTVTVTMKRNALNGGMMTSLGRGDSKAHTALEALRQQFSVVTVKRSEMCAESASRESLLGIVKELGAVWHHFR